MDKTLKPELSTHTSKVYSLCERWTDVIIKSGPTARVFVWHVFNPLKLLSQLQFHHWGFSRDDIIEWGLFLSRRFLQQFRSVIVLIVAVFILVRCDFALTLERDVLACRRAVTSSICNQSDLICTN